MKGEEGSSSVRPRRPRSVGRMTMRIGVSECCQRGGPLEEDSYGLYSIVLSNGCDPAAGFRFKIFLFPLESISGIGSTEEEGSPPLSPTHRPFSSPVTGGRRHCQDFLQFFPFRERETIANAIQKQSLSTYVMRLVSGTTALVYVLHHYVSVFLERGYSSSLIQSECYVPHPNC